MKINQQVGTAISRFCASWVSPIAKAEGKDHLDLKLLGFLFAIPLLGITNLAVTPGVFANPFNALGMLSLAFALPMILAAWLSACKTTIARDAVTVVIGPLALTLISQAHINVALTTAIVLTVIVIEALKREFQTVQIALGAFATVVLASVLIAFNTNSGISITGLAGLAPALVTLIMYLQFKKAPAASEGASADRSDFEIASIFAQASAQALFEVTRTAQVRAISANSYDILGLDRMDVMGAAFIERVHIADRVTLLTHLDQAANSKSEAICTLRIQVGGKSANSGSAWVEVCTKIIESNASLFIIMSALDIAKTHDVAGLQGFDTNALAMVSHELRTPLNAIIGFSDLIAKGLAGPIANGQQREYIDLIHQSGQHLLALVNSILDLSKLENGTYELSAAAFVPEEATAFAISMLANQAREKHIGLDYLPCAGLDEFNGDKRIYQQILINLLSNAVKFTPAHGRINLKVEAHGDRLIMYVEDNGVGMSPDQLSKIGTPFYQASSSHARQHEGAGLGLSLVRKMARLHGGALEISSQEGKGTVVRVALAPLSSKASTLTHIHTRHADESTRIISIDEDLDHGTFRKTA